MISNFNFNILGGEKEIELKMCACDLHSRVGCISSSSALMGQLLRPAAINFRSRLFVPEMRWEIAHPVEEENEKNRAEKRALCADAPKLRSSRVAGSRF